MADSTPKKIALNLDKSTRDDVPEPLFMVIGDKEVQFVDPFELEYRDLDKIENPDAFAKFCVAEEHREHFKKQKLTVWQFKELSRTYMEHYRVDELLGN